MFATNKKEIAEKNKLFDHNIKYEPLLLVLGQNWMDLKLIDEEIMKRDPNTNFKLEIAPKDAYGQRKQDLVKVLPERFLTSRGIRPIQGSQLVLDGKQVTIRHVKSGRITVDYNHPLAGKTLIYEIEVKEKLDKMKDRITSLIHRRLADIDPEDFKINIRGTGITIQHPEESYYLEGIQLSKRAIAADVKRFIPEIEKVKFVEEF